MLFGGVLGPAQTVLTVVGGITGWTAIWFRRRHPFLVAIICGGAAAVSALAFGPVMWALFSLATTRRWRQYAVASLLSVLAIVASGFIDDPTGRFLLITDESGAPVTTSSAIAVTVVVLLLVGVGPYVLVAAWGGQVGNRRELLWSLRERAHQAEEERDLRAAQARVHERQRIAREMHDGLAHRISQISLHAGALAYSGRTDPDTVTQSATVVQEAAHQALEELRGVLGVLRDDATPTSDRPLPTGADIEQLVAEVGEAGLDVDLDLDCGIVRAMPAGIGRAAYRIVQEGLTNVMKHAAGTPASVIVGGRVGDHVLVRVSNPIRLPAPRPPDPDRAEAQLDPAGERPDRGSGYGLVGLQERVELLGGRWRLDRGAGQFVIEARLPWTG